MTDEEKAAESALRENISRKGANSYYYAHGKTANGPVWDGKEEPRLLAVATEKVPSKPIVSAYEFESFSWLDEKKSIKIYIDFKNANDILDEHISLVRWLLVHYLHMPKYLYIRWNYAFFAGFYREFFRV
jgi:hypothetical protein